MGESLLGARAGNVLTKITIILTVVFLCDTLVLAFIFAGPGDPSLMDQMAPPTAADIRTVEPVSEVPTLPAPEVPDDIGNLPLDVNLSAPDASGPTPAPDVLPEISEEPDAL